MNKKIIFGVIALTIILSLFLIKGNMTGDAVNGEVQKVTIEMKNWRYSPQVITVKAGVPVELNLDDSVRGCYRDLMIPGLGIRKYMRTSKDILTFTLEKGEYVFACSMFMGQGKIIAE